MNGAPSWRAVGSTVRGSAHERSGRPNEDAFICVSDSNYAVISVADGHGSPESFRAAIGARLAVDIAANETVERLRLVDPTDWLDASSSGPLIELAGDTIDRWTTAVRDHLATNPFEEEELTDRAVVDDLRAYGSTLLVAAAGPSIAFAYQLGDGHVLAIRQDGTTELAIPEDPELTAFSTYSLCLPNASDHVRAAAWDLTEAPIFGITLSTDGVGASFARHDWYELVGRQIVRSEVNGLDVPQIDRWLSRPAQEGGDDATLALLLKGDGSGRDKEKRTWRHE